MNLTKCKVIEHEDNQPTIQWCVKDKSSTGDRDAKDVREMQEETLRFIFKKIKVKGCERRRAVHSKKVFCFSWFLTIIRITAVGYSS